MSSRLVQRIVVPAGTVIRAGEKLKLSILTSTAGAALPSGAKLVLDAPMARVIARMISAVKEFWAFTFDLFILFCRFQCVVSPLPWLDLDVAFYPGFAPRANVMAAAARLVWFHDPSRLPPRLKSCRRCHG